MSGHTPGPWVWLGTPGSSVLNAAEEKVFDYAGYENLWPGAYDLERDTANMRLIAAAPDLLEALKLILDNSPLLFHPHEDGCFLCDIKTKAEAAIAKAEGR